MKRAVVVLVAGGLAAFGGVAASMGWAQKQSPTPTPEKAGFFEATEHYDREHWAEQHLRNFWAEGEPAQSVYLAAVQRVNLERAQNNVRTVIPVLEKLAAEAPDVQLKSALRRLLVEIHLEEKDFKAAEGELNRIVQENLLQM